MAEARNKTTATQGQGQVPDKTFQENSVSSVFSKRLRALRKKLRNVEEIEKKVREGKTINEQQEEAIRSKPLTLSVIEEVERLKKTVEEELQAKDKERERELRRAEREAERWRKRAEKHQQEKKEEKPAKKERASPGENSSAKVQEAIEKLLKVFYFGRLFDTSTGNNLAHYERAAYLGYDSLLDKEDAAAGGMTMMTQKHLDGLSAFAFYLSSRPMNQLLSHKQALEHCVALAKEYAEGGKRDRMEVPLSDGTLCNLEDMLERISKTGFYNIVPVLANASSAAEATAAVEEAAAPPPANGPQEALGGQPAQVNGAQQQQALAEMDSNLQHKGKPTAAQRTKGGHPKKGGYRKSSRKPGSSRNGPKVAV
ncbi:hypothetical protein HOP50_07g49940 [Chloropicon primus]|uniref:Uncharacterized protein n=1 Tax=Chloropicon primus TaxID=1764295 RepID=A0A5B8MPP1_9CHLO|nr:hypothetical protein A3770_07p49710 [Chloropicon primus]UPR01672.1 hypothetical protein HOP50_07g49940 [Chloropicon primus]|eukprot:QDZ22453.1 hypothetical protein A3770_07p49710 [Chloropicon primus]